MRRFKLFVIWLKTSFRSVFRGLLIMAVLFATVTGVIMGLMKGIAFPGVDGSDRNSLVKCAIVTDDDRFYERVQALITDIAGSEEILSFDRMTEVEAMDSLTEGTGSFMTEIWKLVLWTTTSTLNSQRRCLQPFSVTVIWLQACLLEN